MTSTSVSVLKECDVHAVVFMSELICTLAYAVHLYMMTSLSSTKWI